MPLGVGWQDCQSFAHLPTPPTFAILLPHALFPGQFTFTTILFLDPPHAQAGGWFWSQADIFLAPRVAEHPRTEISRPGC